MDIHKRRQGHLYPTQALRQSRLLLSTESEDYMTANAPTPLNRQELREDVMKTIIPLIQDAANYYDICDEVAKDTAIKILQAIGYDELVKENKTLLKNLEDALREIRILQLNRDY